MSWLEKEEYLSKTFEFADFIQAFGFMTKVAIIAEKLNHHPDWRNVYNKVLFKLSTHEAGNKVTQKDRDLADAISKLYLEEKSQSV
ncbi:4a-hydroxytetrahydrobiopterin dehydratase [Membranihabitans marinus]|uniref:4a-hydroxytetrahydrobiopterin dehydratase n=1 Tax=Membranihabitans marinus TaxID=1227546 RepID=UPI001F01FE6D|nr:4a-hydroxytetrahydrobiopterin dehydratase [Membranihabitans marinus]